MQVNSTWKSVPLLQKVLEMKKLVKGLVRSSQLIDHIEEDSRVMG